MWNRGKSLSTRKIIGSKAPMWIPEVRFGVMPRPRRTGDLRLRWPVKRWNIAREKSWLLDILGTFMYFPRPSCSWLPIGTTYGWSAHLSWDDLKFLWSVRAPWPMQNQGGPAYALGDGKTHNGRGLVRSQPQDFGSKLGPLAQPIPNRTFNFRATSCKGGGFCMRRELQQPTLSC